MCSDRNDGRCRIAHAGPHSHHADGSGLSLTILCWALSTYFTCAPTEPVCPAPHTLLLSQIHITRCLPSPCMLGPRRLGSGPRARRPRGATAKRERGVVRTPRQQHIKRRAPVACRLRCVAVGWTPRLGVIGSECAGVDRKGGHAQWRHTTSRRAAQLHP